MHLTLPPDLRLLSQYPEKYSYENFPKLAPLTSRNLAEHNKTFESAAPGPLARAVARTGLGLMMPPP